MLDLRTVMVLLILTTALSALGLLLVRRTYLPVPGVGSWALGNGLMALAQTLSVAREHLPALFGIVLSNGLTLVAMVVLLAGFQRFTATRVTVLGPGLAVAAGVTALLAWFTFVVPAIGVRAVTITASLAGFNGVIGWLVWPDGGRIAPAQRICAGLYYGGMLFYLYCTWVWFEHPPNGLFGGGDLVAIAFLFAFVKILANGFLQLILVSERLNAEVQRQADDDPLTGALNRRAFARAANRALAQAARTGRPLTLLMFDLDHFKRANDCMGHAFGDSLLCAFIELARQTLRGADLLCRHGGEEFVALLPETDPVQAQAVAERLRRAYATLPAAREVGGTVSIGCAALRPGEDLESLLRRADRALYFAKEAGRNRVICADPTPDEEIAFPAPAG